MDRAGIRKMIVELLENDMGEDFSRLQESQDLRSELGLDSVDLVSVISQIERHFRIRLSQPELEGLTTVGDLLDLLESKVSVPAVAA